jgi:hypothetical protein
MARDQKTHLDKAMDAVVYGPVGAALYVRDALPPFFRLFIMRGKNEIDLRHHRVEEQIRQLKGMGQLAVAFGVPKAKETADRGLADLRTRGEALLEKAAEVAQGAATVAATNAARAPRPTATRPSTAPGPALVPDPTANGAASPVTAGRADPQPIAGFPLDLDAAPEPAPAVTTRRAAGAAPDSAHALPIEGYNELSASQVVERLTGLSPDDLRAVREYETAGRGRKTILGKIEQLGA